jgi:sensor domain CHASE-containing protein
MNDDLPPDRGLAMPIPVLRILGALLAFLATLALGATIIFLNERSQAAQAQRAAVAVASSYAHFLQEQLNRSLSATYALAAVLHQGKGEIDDFDALATRMLHLYGGGISALQLARRGIISDIVPRAGNEVAFGHNLLADPERNREAFAAVETRKLTVAGPFMLIQGGLAVVGRLPVFQPDPQGHEQFWGFTTAVIQISDLLAASKFSDMAALGYDYELSRVNPNHHHRDIFARSSETPLAEPVSFTLEVPNGQWQLSITRAGGWHSPPAVIALEGLLLAVIAGAAALLVYYILRQPYALPDQVMRGQGPG